MQKSQSQKPKLIVFNAPTPAFLSQPTIRELIALHSTPAQQIIEREFNKLSSAFFYLDVSMQYAENTLVNEKFRAASDLAYKQIKEEILTALHNTKKLAEKNGITETATYQNIKQYDVEISSPRSKEFLHLIQLFDELIQWVDSVWITNEELVGGSKHRIEHHQQWQKRITRFIQNIISFQLDQRKQNEAKKAAAATKKAKKVAKKTTATKAAKKTTATKAAKKTTSATPVEQNNKAPVTANEKPTQSREAPVEMPEPTLATNSITATA